LARRWTPSRQALPFFDPQVKLAQGRNRDHAQPGLARVAQADADRPEQQAVDEVAGAVDRVDRPSPRPRTARGRVLLAGEAVVGKSPREPSADHLFEVVVKVGDVTEARLFLGSLTLAARWRAGSAASRKILDEFRAVGARPHRRRFPQVAGAAFQRVF
jgi:hypothetical protein